MRLTKYQQKCEDLAKRLKPLSEAQRRYAEKHLPAYLFKIRNKLHCSECGSVAEETDKDSGEYVCPCCGTRYTKEDYIAKARKGSAVSRYYYGVDTTIGGEQVKRHWMVFKYASVGSKPEYSYVEVSRDFVGEKGQMAVQGLTVRPMSWYYDAWNYSSEFRTRTVRHGTSAYQRHNIDDILTYPIVRKAEWTERRGYNGTPDFLGSVWMKEQLATEPFMEWLVKRDHLEWLREAQLYRLKRFKRELELCDKHGYEISDISMWLDTVDTYREMGRDTLNAKWSRFKDLKAEHDRVMAHRDRLLERERRRREAEERREAMKNAMDYTEQYAECFGGYAGLLFTDGSITVTAITDIPHLLEEGEAMSHCVGTYYDEFDSLILSAKDGEGHRLATIEWCVSEGRVVQCRGAHNSKPAQYDEILTLIDRNREKIRAAV